MILGIHYTNFLIEMCNLLLARIDNARVVLCITDMNVVNYRYSRGDESKRGR